MIAFDFGADIGAFKMSLDEFKNFCAVSFNFVARQLIQIEAVTRFRQCQKNSRNYKGLILFAELSITAQIFMQSFCATNNFPKLQFFGRNFLQDHAPIIGVDIFRREIFKRVDFGQLDNFFVAVNKNRLDDMMFPVADIPESKNFFIARAVDNFVGVEKCAVECKIFRGVDGLRNFVAVTHDEFQAVGFIFHDQNKILDKCNVIGIAALTGLIFRRRTQCPVKFDIVTALRVGKNFDGLQTILNVICKISLKSHNLNLPRNYIKKNPRR